MANSHSKKRVARQMLASIGSACSTAVVQACTKEHGGHRGMFQLKFKRPAG
jgi:hypothetical protein